MRILEVCFSPALGGLELYCLNTAARLQERGHGVSLWLARGSRMAGREVGFGESDLRTEGGSELPLYPLDSRVRGNDNLTPFLFRAPGYINPFFTRKAEKLIREAGIEIIHLHRSQDVAVFAPINVPKILTLQIQSSLPKRDLWHRWVYSRVDRILTITLLMRELALKTLPIDPAKVHVLYYGIPADELCARRGDPQATRRKFNIPEDAFLIGLVGRLEESKGQAVLLRAFRRIYQKYPKAHLLFAGDPPPEHAGYHQYLKSLAGDLGVTERVHFTGFQADTAPIFAALNLCVLASKQEAFGLVLLEAMAQGTPIIATRAGGVPEIIEEGVNGMLVNPGDGVELSAAIERLMAGASLRCSLGEAGFRVVRERFGMEAHLQALEGHFKAII